MSKETHFSPESNQMYYYIREPFDDGIHNNFSEGYAKKVKLTSELSDGIICIDGQIKYDLNYGDICEVEHQPKYSLKCIKFIVWA